jgi:hypothetical protein
MLMKREGYDPHLKCGIASQKTYLFYVSEQSVEDVFSHFPFQSLAGRQKGIFYVRERAIPTM